MGVGEPKYGEDHGPDTESLGGRPRGGSPSEKLRGQPKSEEAHGSSCEVPANAAALFCVGDERVVRIAAQRD